MFRYADHGGAGIGGEHRQVPRLACSVYGGSVGRAQGGDHALLTDQLADLTTLAIDQSRSLLLP